MTRTAHRHSSTAVLRHRSGRSNSRRNTWINRLRSYYSSSFEKRRKDEEEMVIDKSMDPEAMNEVDRVHWYIKENAKSHRTIKFDLVHDKDPKPILRRGQSFFLGIRFKNDFDVFRDRVIFNFKFGSRPSVNKGTMVVLGVKGDKFTKSHDDWDVRIEAGSQGKDLMVKISIPTDAMVGIWNLEIKTGLQSRRSLRGMNVFKDETDCYILFNPWCRDDSVYLEDEVKRQEYVMNDKGKVCVGAYRYRRGRPWAYGQFDDVVLPVAMYILELSRVADSERGNPVRVVRGISAGVNSFDEDGVLEGRWEEPYSDGVPPYQWTGSVRIFEAFVENGYEPVKYGQCWVFSALVTTVCRALGIPCRSVTNFSSAHDTNASLTIDKFFDKEGNYIDGGPDGDNNDSIWNFHVWNDVWMARPDLPPGYGGWQAIDATPQEESDHKMQCGPSSLQAIRRGDIGLNYDAPFVFSEVNADVIHWEEDADSDWGWKSTSTEKYTVGRAVYTKRAGIEDDFSDNDLEDVTNEYKNAEGTEAERLAIHNAIRGSRRARLYYNYKKDAKADCSFDLVDIDKISIGQPFRIKVNARNNSNEPRTIAGYLTARSIYYTGVSVSLVKRAEGKVVLAPGQEENVQLTVTYSEYWKKLVDQCMLKIYAMCRVHETGQTWIDEDDFQVEKPKLDIQVNSVAQVNAFCETSFTFSNPLDMPLTECNLSVDGPGLMRPRVIKIDREVPAHGLFSHTIKFLPRIHGDRKIIASFNSKELFDISGNKTIQVLKRQ